jgi:Domain of unknown function (DUF4440)
MKIKLFYKIIGITILTVQTNFSFAQLNAADSTRFAKQLLTIEHQLMDDIPTGVSKHWDKYLHKDFFIVTEDGSMFDKPAFLRTCNPLPKGYSGYINVTNPKVVFYGNTAIVNYISDEYENVFDSKIHTLYSSMNTYIKNDTSWLMISSQVFEIPLLPPAIQLPVNVLKQYTGIYQLADSVTCTISILNDTLFYQRAGRTKVALLPETQNIFFRLPDTRGRKLFALDDKGVMLMRERRNGQDVVWKRIKN